jgi:hypothetical protein
MLQKCFIQDFAPFSADLKSIKMSVLESGSGHKQQKEKL